jgi:hypothetical protein
MDILETNIQTIAQALSAIGATSATVEYSGTLLEHYDYIVDTICDNRTFGKPQDDAGSEISAWDSRLAASCIM